MSSAPGATTPTGQKEPLLQGRYRITRILGSGGMGDVFLADDLRLSRQVAIKSIKREFCKMDEVRKRIERECVMHAQLGAHPNIIALFDRIDDNGQIHLVMEYVDGVTLKDVIDRARNGELYLTWRESTSIACQVLEALARMHTQDIIHRDVKPANIMLTQNDTGNYVAKLMDFGISRLMNPVDGATMLTRQGSSGPGTPIYMAPEQIAGTQYGSFSPATDIYAMGVMLFQMLTGHPPFQGTITDIFHGHLNAPPPPIDTITDSSYPPVLTEIVHKAMSKIPSDRFGSAAEFRYWLRRVVKSRAPITSLTLTGPIPSTASEVGIDATVPLVTPTVVSDAPAGTGLVQRRDSAAKTASRMVALVAIVLAAVATGVAANLYFFGTRSETAEANAQPTVTGAGMVASPVLSAPVAPQPQAPQPQALQPQALQPQAPQPVSTAAVSPESVAPIENTPAAAPVMHVPDDPAPVSVPEPAAEAPKPTPAPKPAKKPEPVVAKEPDLVTPETEEPPMPRQTAVPKQTPVPPSFSTPRPAPYQTPVPGQSQTPSAPTYPHYSAPQSSAERAQNVFKDMQVNKLPTTKVN